MRRSNQKGSGDEDIESVESGTEGGRPNEGKESNNDKKIL